MEQVTVLKELKTSGQRYEVIYEASGYRFTVTGALRDAYTAGDQTFVAIHDEQEKDLVHRHINVKYIRGMKAI